MKKKKNRRGVDELHYTQPRNARHTQADPTPSNIKPCVACCKRCGKRAEKRCSTCHTVMYCNTECQRKHWAEHKEICKNTATPNFSGFVYSASFGHNLTSGDYSKIDEAIVHSTVEGDLKVLTSQFENLRVQRKAENPLSAETCWEVSGAPNRAILTEALSTISAVASMARRDVYSLGYSDDEDSYSPELISSSSEPGSSSSSEPEYSPELISSPSSSEPEYYSDRKNRTKKKKTRRSTRPRITAHSHTQCDPTPSSIKPQKMFSSTRDRISLQEEEEARRVSLQEEEEARVIALMMVEQLGIPLSEVGDVPYDIVGQFIMMRQRQVSDQLRKLDRPFKK